MTDKFTVFKPMNGKELAEFLTRATEEYEHHGTLTDEFCKREEPLKTGGIEEVVKAIVEVIENGRKTKEERDRPS